MTDKYERVTDMTIGQVVDAMLGGEKFHYCSGTCDKSRDGKKYAEYDLDQINIRSGVTGLYRKVEAPWWEKHIGSIVMVRDSDDESWTVCIFKEFVEFKNYGFVEASDMGWRYMRPLTQAEKDAIITEG